MLAAAGGRIGPNIGDLMGALKVQLQIHDCARSTLDSTTQRIMMNCNDNFSKTTIALQSSISTTISAAALLKCKAITGCSSSSALLTFLGVAMLCRAG